LPRREENHEFNRILLESISETISGLLSERVTNALYSHIERVHSVTKVDVPNRLDVLSTTLEDNFGAKGSLTISKAIAKRLYNKLELSAIDISTDQIRTLQDYVETARIEIRRRGTKP
jgi:hypothetical protein